MSYFIQSKLVFDGVLDDRVMACAAMEGVEDPSAWLTPQRKWRLSAQPGWVPAYASALEAHKTGSAPPPGENEAAITDGMILAGVQALVNPSS